MSAGLVTDEATMGRLYRIRRTVMQMLRDRGYLVGEHELATSRRGFLRKFGESFHREDLLINKYKKDDPSDQIYVFFPNDDKVGMKHIKKYVEMMTHENVSRAVLALQQNLTPYQTASKNTDYGSHCKVLWPQTRSGSEDHQTQ